jgi:hypothetical protein
VRFWALVETGDRETIEMFVRSEDAEQALADCLSDQPEWQGLLRLEELELSGPSEPSPN